MSEDTLTLLKQEALVHIVSDMLTYEDNYHDVILKSLKYIDKWEDVRNLLLLWEMEVNTPYLAGISSKRDTMNILEDLEDLLWEIEYWTEVDPSMLDTVNMNIAEFLG